MSKDSNVVGSINLGRFVWILLFDETGKIVKIREYMNTALVREVMTNN